MIAAPPEVQAQFQAPGRRYTDDELVNISNQPVQPPRGGGPGQRGAAAGGGGDADNFNQRRVKFFLDEGGIATVESGLGTSGPVVLAGGGRPELEDAPCSP